MDWGARIGRRLKPRDLHVFMAVAEDGNMAKAAGWLGTTASGLQDYRGPGAHAWSPLFDRNPQGVELTLYGRALFKRSLAVFDELRGSVQEIEFLADPAAGSSALEVMRPQPVDLSRLQSIGCPGVIRAWCFIWRWGPCPPFNSISRCRLRAADKRGRIDRATI